MSLVITCPEVSKDQQVVSNQALERDSRFQSVVFIGAIAVYSMS